MRCPPLFVPMCHPFATNMTSFCVLAPGARKLPVGGPRYDLHNLRLNSDAISVTFATYANQFVTKRQSVQNRIHSVQKKLPMDGHEHTNPQVGSAGARSVMKVFIHDV